MTPLPLLRVGAPVDALHALLENPPHDGGCLLFLAQNEELVFCVVSFFVFCLLSIRFFTLLERKILRSFQQRKGPNKLGFFGEFQPFSDALKLYRKESFIIFSFLKIIFYLSSSSLLLLICLL